MCKATTKGVYDDHTTDRGDYNDCPDGWFNSVDDVTGHYCIRAFSELETQNGAETACNNQHGGSLVSIHGPEKNQRVGQVATAAFGTQNFWIGPQLKEGWGWTDGSAMNYENWSLGEPSNSYHCAVYEYNSMWMSADCTIDTGLSKPFVCQIPRPQELCKILELERVYADRNSVRFLLCF